MSYMPKRQVNCRIPEELLADLDAAKPDYLDRNSFVCLLLATALDRGPKLPAYRVGAGYHQQVQVTATGSTHQPAEAVESLPVETVSIPTPPCDGVLGDGVGMGSGETPRKPPFNGAERNISPSLFAHQDLILDFWRVKGGSKGQRAWALLQTELTKIQTIHGDDTLRQQLELAINGKWKGITLANLERFTQPSTSANNGYVDSITRDRQARQRFLGMFSDQEAA